MLENGCITVEGRGRELLQNEMVKKAFLDSFSTPG